MIPLEPRGLLSGGTSMLCEGANDKGNGLVFGIRKAGADIGDTLYADGSMDPAGIPNLVEPLLEKYDSVEACRSLPGGGTWDIPCYRSLGKKLLAGLVNLLYEVNYTDLGYGSNALRKGSSEQVKFHSDGFQIEIVIRRQASEARRKVTEVRGPGRRRASRTGSLLTIGDGSRILEPSLKERVHG